MLDEQAKVGCPWLSVHREAFEPYVPGNDLYSRVIKWHEKRYPPTYLYDDTRVQRQRAGMRTAMTLRYSWAIPSPGVLERIADLAGKEGIIEVGAGTGYWASLLAEMGVYVVAFDRNPPSGNKEGPWHSRQKRSYFDVQKRDVENVPWLQHMHRTLFLCWPPYNDRMGGTALKRYAMAGGEQVVLISEGPGGCVGDETMWNALGDTTEYGEDAPTEEEIERRQLFEEVDYAFDGTAMPQWYGLHDHPSFWRRKS